MNRVEYAEKILGYELLPWQREFLQRLDNGERPIFFGPRIGKTMMYDIDKDFNQKNMSV